jgi:hypothetical protein
MPLNITPYILSSKRLLSRFGHEHLKHISPYINDLKWMDKMRNYYNVPIGRKPVAALGVKRRIILKRVAG